MIKKYKWLLLISSVIILLPMLFGIILWDELPEILATHWGVDNQPNGYSSRAMAVYGMPLIMLAVQWFCVLTVELDIKKRNHGPEMIKLMLCVIPVMTVLVMTVTYAYALGISVNMGFWALFFLGLLFMVIGNYLPKCRQNWTIGIKVPWTLSDPENWNKTHRMAGPIWMAGGFVMVVGSFFSRHQVVAYGMFAVILLMVMIPAVYSYLYYKKHRSEDE